MAKNMSGNIVSESFQAMPSEEAFILFQRLVQKKLGIYLSKQKRLMLGHRLAKRLAKTNIASFSHYYRYINSPENSAELELALELITTNETFFFREPQHFDFLEKHILPQLNPNKEFKVWSAASSTGEEAYSIAMLLSQHYQAPWSLCASDVNKSVINHAKKGIYQNERAKLLPQHYKESFCCKGIDEYQGYIRVKPALRQRINFFCFNLLDPMEGLGQFDVIFIRNVMIYFEDETRQAIINAISKRLSVNGYLFISHSETLHGLEHKFELIQPAIYRLQARCL